MNKKTEWKKMQRRVDLVTDKLGKSVDKNIKETVIVFNLLGFPTRQSCGGHLSKYGLPFPWIDIRAKEPEGWRKNKQKKIVWENKTLKYAKRMIAYLKEFYADRNTPYEAILGLEYIIVSNFRIRSIGGNVSKIASLSEKKKRLKLFRKEMCDFTEFLKVKFFSE